MKKDFSKNERYAMKFFKNNGFEFEVLKQYNSKTKFKIQKDGLSYEWELLAGVEDIKKYMSMFVYSHEQKLEIQKLKEQLNE